MITLDFTKNTSVASVVKAVQCILVVRDMEQNHLNNNFHSAFLSTSDRLVRCGHDYENYSFTLSVMELKFLIFLKTPLNTYFLN